MKKARTLLPPSGTSPGELACWVGRVSELSQPRYGGALTLTAGLMAQVQERGEQTAWLTGGSGMFFPPDLAARGIDLAAVTVVRAAGGLQAADWLLRSGAFGLIVLDQPARATDSELARLGRLAEEAGTAVIILTLKEESTPSLGTQVALRVAVRSFAGGAEAVTLKDRRGGQSRTRWSFDGPMGLY